MKHSTNLMIRLYSLLVAVMAFGLNASADNRLSIEDFTITPGEEKELAVVLENADPVSSIQFDMTLPVGLEVTKVTKNADRLKSHNAGMRKQTNGDVRVVVLTTATVLENTAFKGNEGAILTLKVKANSTFKGGQIKVHSIDASDATVAEPIERVIGDFTVKAKVNAGTFSVAPESVNVSLAEGQEAQIDLSVANMVNIAGLQVDVQLPENLEVTEIVKGERVSDNYDPSPTEIAAGSSATVVLSSLMVEDFAGNDGVVLSLKVKATGEVDGRVTFSNVQTTDMSGDASFVMEGEGDVAVKFYYTYYKVVVAEGIENGSVTADKAEAKAGDMVALTITPAADYKLDVLTVTYGEENTAVEVAEGGTFSMPEGDVAISATFVPVGTEPEATYAEVKMTYVSNESAAGDADKAFGEVTEAYAGYNKIANGEVGFGNTGWGCNWITYIRVDASALEGGVVKSAKLSAEVSGSTDSKRTTTWGVGYNGTAWSADMTYNTADKSITTLGATFAGTKKSVAEFDVAEFDITEAFAAGNKTATILVYETAAAGGIIKNVKVEVEMGDKEIEVDGIIYAIKSDNLIKNGSFDEGVADWKTVGYTTDAVIDNFGYATEGGFDNGAFITTNAAGVGSEKTLRQSVAVEPGKQYYFTVYTSGKAPEAQNFNYNALFQMTDAVTENGVIKAFEWPQGAAQTSEEWSQTECVFTASEGNPFVGVRMGWNADSRFDGFALYEVEMKTSAVEAARTLALAELDKLAPVGDGVFMYAQADIDAAKAAIEAATTVEEIEAVVKLAPVAPDPEKRYVLSLTTSEGSFELNTGDGVKIVAVEEGTPVTFVAQEGGAYAIFDGAKYVNYEGSNKWTTATTDEAYGWTIAAVEGGYTITGKNGLFGTNTSDGNVAGSACYGDKNTGNGNCIWTITPTSIPTGIEGFASEGKAKVNGGKYMENGRVVIYRNGKKFSTAGVELK